jgi:hypothetical protein
MIKVEVEVTPSFKMERIMPEYYMVNRITRRVVAGPFGSPYIVAALVDAQEQPTDYGSASRYELAKTGWYPRNQKGEKQLKQDVESTGKYKNSVITCKHCGDKLFRLFYGGWMHNMDLSTDECSIRPDGEICGKAEPAAQ